jgi:hypothetical protein
LVELAKPSTRWTIRTPHWLDLITFEKLRQLVAIFRNHASQWNSQVISKRKIGFTGFFMFTAFKDLVDELVAFLTILPQERFDIFNCGRFEWFKSVALVHLFHHADDVVAPPNISRKEVAHAARRLRVGLAHLLEDGEPAVDNELIQTAV